MITESSIRSFITKLKDVSDITVVRADQLFKKQSYPYATYKILSSNEEAFVSNIQESSYNSGTQITTKIHNQLNESIVSLNVFSDTHEEANESIQTLFESLKSTEIYDNLKSNSMSVILGLTNIQDRTIFLESAYEYRFGFDFTLRANTTYTKDIESIENVNAEIEIHTSAQVKEINIEVNS